MNAPWYVRFGEDLREFAGEFPFITTTAVLILLALIAVAVFVPGGWFWVLVGVGIIVALVLFMGVIYEFTEKM